VKKSLPLQIIDFSSAPNAMRDVLKAFAQRSRERERKLNKKNAPENPFCRVAFDRLAIESKQTLEEVLRRTRFSEAKLHAIRTGVYFPTISECRTLDRVLGAGAGDVLGVLLHARDENKTGP